MSTIAELQCSGCGADLAISCEDAVAEERPVRCRHRTMREHSGDGPCPLCAISDERVRTKCMTSGPVPVCAQCAERDEEEAELRARLEAEDKRIQLSRIPKSLQRLRWDELIVTGERAVAIAAASKWAEAAPDEARGIYLWGGTGTGKTRLAATAAWERLTVGQQPIQWVSVAVLLARMEASFSDKERQASLEVLTGDSPLVLDDLDKLNPTEGKRAQLYAAIDRRIVAKVPLLVTGNLSPKQLEDQLGDAIASRVLGYCLGRTFQMDGPDRRMDLGI